MKFYNEQGQEITNVSFGRVRMGESAEINLIAKNDGEHPLIDISFGVDNADVNILNAPKNLRPGEQEAVRLKWSAKVNSEFGLKCKISWKADELRGEE